MTIVVAKRLGVPAQECRVLMTLGGHVSPWRAPLRDSVPLLRESMAAGIRSGELLFAAIAVSDLAWALFALGVNLDQVIAESEAALAFDRKIGHTFGAEHVLLMRQVARSLKGVTRSPSSFDDEGFDEASYLAGLGGNPVALAGYHLCRLQTAYLFGDHPGARASSQAAGSLLAVFRSLFLTVDYFFYTGLVASALFEDADSADKEALMRGLRDALAKLRAWADHAPMNWSHKRDLLVAELARVEGREAEAAILYAQSIEGAHRAEFLQDEAIAHERCGRFHLRRGELRMADLHLNAALDAYARWGASGKVRQMQSELTGISGIALRPSVPPSSSAMAPALEHQSLLKATETLTGELRLDRLLAKLVVVCGQAASAGRTALILDRNGSAPLGGLIVRATADVQGEVALEATPLAASQTVPASLIEHVHRSGETVVLQDAARDARFVDDRYLAAHEVRSALVMPVRRGERHLGVLYFENRLATDAFTTERLQTLRLLSAGVAIALENSLLFEERAHAESAVGLLADASVVLAESLDYNTIVAKVARLVVPVLADWCTVDLVEPGRVVGGASAHADPAKAPLVKELRRRYPLDKDSQQPGAQALRSMRRVVLADADDETIRSTCRDPEHERMVRALHARSLLALPLVARGRVLGVMTLVSGEPRRYGTRDIALAEQLAQRIAMAIDNARLYREAQVAIGLRDEFLSVASHEFRGPVHSLQLAIQSLRAGTVPASAERLPRLLEIADRQTARMTRLIDEMLSVGRIQEGRLQLRLQSVDLVVVIREVAAGLSHDLTRARCSLDIHAPATLVGRWDRTKLEQAVTNLLSNAMKFGAGKPVDVTVEERAGLARLFVRDRGIGIEAEQLPRIFERFARAVSAREYGGLGLGLYIVRAIVEALGGTVRVESVVGEGSIFSVELPCAGPSS